jgi:Lar family restriction alleviation protein
MNKEELKPCPFCGKEGLLIRECNIPGEEWVQYYVMCDFVKCGTYQCKYFTREDAIKGWNKRI